ncbi:MAG TPA: hypothetical protein VH439_17115 [Gemmatimonadales bacterium]|jgi:hypothetical protein
MKSHPSDLPAPYAALLINDGTIQRIHVQRAQSGQSHIRELIGDSFSSCFTLPGTGGRRLIIAYCDDRYLDKPRADLPWNVMLDPHTVYRDGWPVAGPIVVTTVVAPDTVSMNELEMAALRIDAPPPPAFLFEGEVLTLPLLIFRPGYDVERLAQPSRAR